MRAPNRGPGRKTSSKPAPSTGTTRASPSGLEARRLAVRLLETVLHGAKSLDDALDEADRAGWRQRVEPRDRAFARLLAATVLRHKGSLEAVVATFLERPLPVEGRRAHLVLLVAAAQLLFLGTPPYAAIDMAVEQCRGDRVLGRYQKLCNAVLRRVSERGMGILTGLDRPQIDFPDWLWNAWVVAYGVDTARTIAGASLREAPLDITVRGDTARWVERLGGRLLPTGSIRVLEHGPVETMEGFAEGAWWVQDAAAALPVRLLGDVTGLSVADVCAAPGGKTAALAIAGAHVTAIDQSERRMKRLDENMRRLGLSDRVTAIVTDAATWRPATPFDAILLDAPCTATGTIRRHPDILRLKHAEDVARLAGVQALLLEHVIGWLKPGGRLVFCTCSLQPEEGEMQIERLLASHPEMTRLPCDPATLGLPALWFTDKGELRTQPHLLALETPEASGMDGFFSAVLQRGPATANEAAG